MLSFGVLPRSVPELPLPFGFHGWFYDLALGVAVAVCSATGWALWGMVAAYRCSRPAHRPLGLLT